MEYISTLETIEGFWNALAGCSKHQVSWTILYTLVNVRGSRKLLIVVRKVPCSLSVNFEACHFDGLQEYSGGP